MNWRASTERDKCKPVGACLINRRAYVLAVNLAKERAPLVLFTRSKDMRATRSRRAIADLADGLRSGGGGGWARCCRLASERGATIEAAPGSLRRLNQVQDLASAGLPKKQPLSKGVRWRMVANVLSIGLMFLRCFRHPAGKS